MIVALYCVFNEEALIAESIRSVKSYVDRFVIVDAVFTSNPADATHSTDRTRQVAEAAADPLPVLYAESDRKLALDVARNRAFSLLDRDDWALIIDGDETLLGDRDELRRLFSDARRSAIDDPVGASVYTSALDFRGHAPAIDAVAYEQLPVHYTRGVQARLVPVDGMAWRLVPNGRSYGLYRDAELVTGKPADPRLTIVNHRTRQTFEAYQSDYVWETGLYAPATRSPLRETTKAPGFFVDVVGDAIEKAG